MKKKQKSQDKKCDRSETMRRVHSTDTSLEMILRKELWMRGMRYRLNYKLPGKPDLVFPGSRLAVFIDSCFWHGCPEHCRMPSSNQTYWNGKISGNVKRDVEITETLKSSGWNVIRIWEHDIKENLYRCATIIENALKR